MKAEVDVGLVGGAGLGVGAGSLDGAADAAPEVRLPTGLAGERQVVVGGEFAVIGGAVLRDIVARNGRSGRERRVESGAGHGDLVAGGEVVFQRLAEGLVVGFDALFELVELRVVVDLPPLAAQQAVGGIGGLPCATGGGGRGNDRGCAGLFVGCRSLVAGAVVIRADGLAGGEKDSGDK